MEEDIAYENMDALRPPVVSSGVRSRWFLQGQFVRTLPLKLYTNKSISLCYTH